MKPTAESLVVRAGNVDRQGGVAAGHLGLLVAGFLSSLVFGNFSAAISRSQVFWLSVKTVYGRLPPLRSSSRPSLRRVLCRLASAP